MGPRKVLLAFYFMQDTKLSTGSAAGCPGLMNVHRGPGFAESPGLPYKQVCSGGGRLQSALPWVLGRAHSSALSLASQQALGHISSELVVTF